MTSSDPAKVSDWPVKHRYEWVRREAGPWGVHRIPNSASSLSGSPCLKYKQRATPNFQHILRGSGTCSENRCLLVRARSSDWPLSEKLTDIPVDVVLFSLWSFCAARVPVGARLLFETVPPTHRDIAAISGNSVMERGRLDAVTDELSVMTCVVVMETQSQVRHAVRVVAVVDYDIYLLPSLWPMN